MMFHTSPLAVEPCATIMPQYTVTSAKREARQQYVLVPNYDILLDVTYPRAFRSDTHAIYSGVSRGGGGGGGCFGCSSMISLTARSGNDLASDLAITTRQFVYLPDDLAISNDLAKQC